MEAGGEAAGEEEECGSYSGTGGVYHVWMNLKTLDFFGKQGGGRSSMSDAFLSFSCRK